MYLSLLIRAVPLLGLFFEPATQTGSGDPYPLSQHNGGKPAAFRYLIHLGWAYATYFSGFPYAEGKFFHIDSFLSILLD
jgi:hypothetical protein